MLLPFYGVPETIAQALERHREVFFREEGFAHVSRYITGLVLSPNKTLQGIYNAQAWGGEKPSRRAMHEAVFEAGWDSEELMAGHREAVAEDHRGRGREVISLDWTACHHARGPKIYAATPAYD